MDALISVAMATYNGEKYIKEQIETILNQSLMPEEIIICDDCSTDDTISIIKSFNNPIIKLFINEKKIGVVENFKKAVYLTNPQNFVALADQDDIWINQKLFILYNEIKHLHDSNIPAIAYSDLTLIDNTLAVVNESFWNELNHHHHEHNFTTLLFGNFVTGHSIFMNAAMKKEFCKKPNDSILHDVWIALIANGLGEAFKINKSLAFYRQHEKNVNYNSTLKKNSRFEDRIKKLKFIFKNSNYLGDEFKIAKTFYTIYKNELSFKNRLIIENFLKAEGMTFIYKYLLLKRYFKNYWIK